MKQPKVSIILPTKNCESSVQETLISINAQNYDLIELIIVDGRSTDRTVDIVKKIYPKAKIIISEPKGIADAFNVGVKAAKGDYLYFIGASDYFENESVVEKMMKDVDCTNDWLVCGKVSRVRMNGEVLYTTKTNFNKLQLLYKMALPHQGLFTSKHFFEKYGMFDESCKYAMDYELLLRAYKEFPKVLMKDVVVANWVEGGVGQNDTLKVLTEYDEIRKKNKIAPKMLLSIIYFLEKSRYGYR